MIKGWEELAPLDLLFKPVEEWNCAHGDTLSDLKTQFTTMKKALYPIVKNLTANKHYKANCSDFILKGSR
jgi:hypothetical protein